MSENMTDTQFQTIMDRFDTMDHRLDKMDGRLDMVDSRLDHVEQTMVTKSDVFQSVFTVQAFTAAAIVGTVVVLNAVGAFG